MQLLSYFAWTLVSLALVGAGCLAIMAAGWYVAHGIHYVLRFLLPWPVALGLTALLTPLTIYGTLHWLARARRRR